MERSKRVVPESETRQRVRKMLAADMTVREIADALGLSVQVIYRHKRAIAARDAA